VLDIGVVVDGRMSGDRDADRRAVDERQDVQVGDPDRTRRSDR